MNNNPLQLMQMLKNPQAFMQNMMNNSQFMQNPIINNAMQMYQKGDMDGLNKLAENMCKENNTTMEQMKSQIMKQFGMN